MNDLAQEALSLDRQWFPVITKPKSEDIAQVNLERQGFNVCAPKLQVRKRRTTGWQQVIEPMFPGYVFVELAFGTDNVGVIRSTRGCQGLVRFGTVHVPVPQEIMQSLMRLGELAPNVSDSFKPGDRVRIEAGPFAGLEGVYQLSKGEDRVQLLIEMLGKAQRLLLDSRWVARVE